MEHFSWLHLTDLHRGMEEQCRLWPNVKEIFFSDLKALHSKCGPWDLVLFTGDLTQQGSEDEFRLVDKFMEELWDHLEKLGSSPRLLAIPGNHDVLRPDPQQPEVILLSEWSEREKIQNELGVFQMSCSKRPSVVECVN